MTQPKTPININHVLINLAIRRPLFHSEADFQHAFSWQLQLAYPECEIRLERPLRAAKNVISIDVFVLIGEQEFAIELKYKTNPLNKIYAGEQYDLADHGARDCGGYDFIKDICRVEEIVRTRGSPYGWAVLLTNDSNYWRPPTTNAYAAFRLNEGRTLENDIGWPEGTPIGTAKGREGRLRLSRKYALKWNDYSDLEGRNGKFRYLAVQMQGEFT